MYFFDVSTPIAIIGALILALLFLLLGKERKEGAIVAIYLGAFVALLVIHTVQLITLPEQYLHNASTLGRCITVDFVFVLLSYISYLWVDDIETKYKNKKSIDNSLEWFWKKV